MIAITWIFCLAVLWTKALDTQADEVPPLIMAVYGKGESKRITLTDSEAVNVEDLELPLDKTEPTFIALLCKDDDKNSSGDDLKVEQVVSRINYINKNLKCSSHSQSYVEPINEESTSFNIGFKFKMNARALVEKTLMGPMMQIANTGIGIMNVISDQHMKPLPNNLHTSSFRFMTEFGISLGNNHVNVSYLTIRYNFELMIPESITHRVIAHMYSEESVKACEKIEIRKGIKKEQKTYEELVEKFDFNNVPATFQWRQLVPKEDFQGIYTIEGTCIYLNYILLHNEALQSLKNIEIFTRKVADVINEVSVVSGTYIKRNDDSVRISDEKGNTIPTIVWKKVSYKLDKTHYTVLVIIHNQETERFCDEQNEWGWPEHNREEKIESHKEKSEEKLPIGTMYNCSMNSEMSQKLTIEDTPYLPFNLYKVPHKDGEINVLQRIEAKDSSSKSEQ